MDKLTVFIFLLFLSPVQTVFSQRTIAMPQIINYSSKMYKGGLQNWGVAQDANGILYFGNNEGLLVFDGRYWRVYPLPNATIVRSVCYDGQGRIYVGGQDELGYFEADSIGSLHYHSLLDRLPKENQQFADVWHIAQLDDHIFFQTNNYIFHYYQDKINVDRPHSSWQFMTAEKGELYAHEMEHGIMHYADGEWIPMHEPTAMKGMMVTGIMASRRDTLVVSTLKDGLFYLSKGNLAPMPTAIDAQLKTHRISSIRSLSDGLFAIGMYAGGMAVMDREGAVVQRYVYEEGLQTNNVRDIFVDRDHNVWLALDDGIDYMAINSAIKYIYPDRKTMASAYSMHIFQNNLYIGTSNGLYKSPFASGDIGMSAAQFDKVDHSEGQVWSVQEMNGRLLLGHEDGSFEVRNGTVQPISRRTGNWIFRATSRVAPAQHIIAGSYLGLQYITFDGQQFIDGGHIEGSYESLRFVHYDSKAHAIWASHPYRGVFKLLLSADFKKITQQRQYGVDDGLPEMLHNYVFNIRSDIVVSTPKGVYVYDAEADRFRMSAAYEALGNQPLQYMVEDKLGNVWFASNKRLGVLDFSKPVDGQAFTISYFPELNGKILGGFESIYVHDVENVFISGQKGGILLNYKAYQDRASKPNVLLRMVKAFDTDKNEQLLFGGYTLDSLSAVQLAYAFNSLQLDFSSTLYDQQDQVEFSYMLEGLENNWSVWSNKSEKEYTNLPAGTYVFKIKSRNGMGNESEIQAYTFRVKPPWYAHPASFVFYAVLIVLFIGWLLNVQRKKLKQRHQDELHLRQLEIEKKEKEVIKLRNEKLEAELGFKDKELANLTMNIIQRGEVLGKIKDSITQTMNRFEDKEAKSNFRQLTRLIRSAERTNEDWEKFNTHIHHANESFFFRLKQHHPDLTANELKLCALIRMNLQTKEMAQLMHVSVKAVEVGRYRLRKKLKIDSEVNLYDYLMQYAKSEE